MQSYIQHIEIILSTALNALSPSHDYNSDCQNIIVNTGPFQSQNCANLNDKLYVHPSQVRHHVQESNTQYINLVITILYCVSKHKEGYTFNVNMGLKTAQYAAPKKKGIL